jgi:hypothetical protein
MLEPIPGGIATGSSSPAASALLGDVEPDDVSPLLNRLQDLGGSKAQVSPWGSDGKLFRCSCRANVSDTSLLSRHFEAVAREPAGAVEQVLAKVEAWRAMQQN